MLMYQWPQSLKEKSQKYLHFWSVTFPGIWGKLLVPLGRDDTDRQDKVALLP